MALRETGRPTLIHIGALSGFTWVTLLVTYPLVFRLAEGVPGWPGDNVLHVWLLWWLKRALVDLHISPNFNLFVYFPDGFEMARTEMTPFPPSTLYERRDRLMSFPDMGSMDALEEYGTAYVLVHTDQVEDWRWRIEKWGATGQLLPTVCFEALCVYPLEVSE